MIAAATPGIKLGRSAIGVNADTSAEAPQASHLTASLPCSSAVYAQRSAAVAGLIVPSQRSAVASVARAFLRMSISTSTCTPSCGSGACPVPGAGAAIAAAGVGVAAACRGATREAGWAIHVQTGIRR